MIVQHATEKRLDFYTEKKPQSVNSYMYSGEQSGPLVLSI